MPRYLTDGSWRKEAACLGAPLDWFFPEMSLRDVMTPEAFQLCSFCPVYEHCYEDAINTPQNDAGIRAGTTPRERTRIRRERGLKFLEPISHGTTQGYAAERRRKLPHCKACQEAHRLYQIELKEKRRAV